MRTAATPIRHREATEADLSAISALGMQVNLLHHEAFPQLFAGPADPERDAAHWAMSIAQPMATTFLAEHVGTQAPSQLIGFIRRSGRRDAFADAAGALRARRHAGRIT